MLHGFFAVFFDSVHSKSKFILFMKISDYDVYDISSSRSCKLDYLKIESGPFLTASKYFNVVYDTSIIIIVELKSCWAFLGLTLIIKSRLKYSILSSAINSIPSKD